MCSLCSVYNMFSSFLSFSIIVFLFLPYTSTSPTCWHKPITTLCPHPSPRFIRSVVCLSSQHIMRLLPVFLVGLPILLGIFLIYHGPAALPHQYRVLGFVRSTLHVLHLSCPSIFPCNSFLFPCQLLFLN